MRLLLLSAYEALSHQHWREQLQQGFSGAQWTVLSLPPRHFNYRVRGNPLSWLSTQQAALNKKYDLVIATSMVDIATLRGIVPTLASTPFWMYCHENQFAYPASAQQQSALQQGNRLQAQMVFLYNCLSANSISFNSAHNRDTALFGLRDLLYRLPEAFDDDLLDSVASRCDVLPVPVDACTGGQAQRVTQAAKHEHDRTIDIVWNHRWEYDKGPEHLLAFAKRLARMSPSNVSNVSHARLRVRLHVIGAQFREQPPAFAELAALLDQCETQGFLRKGYWGFIESKAEYQDLLARADLVLSTAKHDFQGLSILEACNAGCLPLLPNSVVYPEYFDQQFLYRWCEDPDENAEAMLEKFLAICTASPATLEAINNNPQPSNSVMPDLQQFSWRLLKPRYQEKLEALSGCLLAAT